MEEIDRDFYCSSKYDPTDDRRDCLVIELIHNCKNCRCCHRKWPTEKQFKEEYGREWEGAVYILHEGYMGGQWEVMGYDLAKHQATVNPNLIFYFICASTSWGKPPDDWRPE
jgi:hypothetical protein